MTNAAKCKNLTETLNAVYGVSLASSPVEAILWSANSLIGFIGLEKARRELSAANKLRCDLGKMPAFAPYGSPLF